MNKKLKNDTMNESDLQTVYYYPIYRSDSKAHSDKGFVNTDKGSQGGTHWTCYRMKDNKNCFLIVSVELLINFY